MIRTSLVICAAFLSLPVLAQEPAKATREIHTIPAETLKTESALREPKPLKTESDKSIYSAEIDKSKNQVTLTPMPVEEKPAIRKELEDPKQK